MHCKSVSYKSFLGNLLIFRFSFLFGVVNQSLKMSNEKSDKGIALACMRRQLLICIGEYACSVAYLLKRIC